MGKKLTKEEFIERANRVHCEKYDYANVKYENNKTKVCIVCPQHGEFWQTPHAHINLQQGCWQCYLDKQNRNTCGVGNNDVRNSNSTKAYGVWKDLLKRCCDSKYKSKFRAYAESYICEEWKTFSNFKNWFDEHYIDGWQLDKDILVKGNQLYSPSTCCFLPRELNNIYKRNLSGRSLPQCCRLTKSGKYYVCIKAQKKPMYIGTFDTIEEAFYMYKTHKERLIKETAKKYETKLDTRAFNALLNFEIVF